MISTESLETPQEERNQEVMLPKTRTRSGIGVILQEISGKYYSILLGSNMPQKLDKIRGIDVTPLINQPYGSIFELRKQKLIRISEKYWQNEEDENNSNNNNNIDDSSNIHNDKDICDTNSSQKLSIKEIILLRDNLTVIPQ